MEEDIRLMRKLLKMKYEGMTKVEAAGVSTSLEGLGPHLRTQVSTLV